MSYNLSIMVKTQRRKILAAFINYVILCVLFYLMVFVLEIPTYSALLLLFLVALIRKKCADKRMETGTAGMYAEGAEPTETDRGTSIDT